MKQIATALITATVAIGALTVTGCQTTPSTSAPNYSNAPSYPVNSQVLQAYDWQLMDAKLSDGTTIAPLFYNAAKPLTLHFMSDGNSNRVAFVNTCNNLGASYDIRGGSVVLGNVLSTMMACPEPQASFDTATMAVVQGKYSVSKPSDHPAVLTIQGNDHVAHFKAVTRAAK